MSRFTCQLCNAGGCFEYFIGSASLLKTDHQLHVQDLQLESDHSQRLTLALPPMGSALLDGLSVAVLVC